MAEWTVCPHCHLRHTQRADGLCPKCKQPVGAGTTHAPAPARSGQGPAVRTSLPDVYDGSVPPRAGLYSDTSAAAVRAGEVAGEASPWGRRIAGLVLLVNGIASVVGKLALPTAEGVRSHAVTATMVVDLLVGLLLVAGSEKVVFWAVLRAALGGIGFSILHFNDHELFSAALQIAYSVGLLALLLGEPGKGRLAFGGLAAGGSVGLACVALAGGITGDNPLGRLMLWGQIEPEPVTVVQGASARYRLTLPGDRWYLAKPEIMGKDATGIDRALVRPDRDAYIMIMAVELPPVVGVDLGRLEEVMLEGLKKSLGQLEIVASEHITAQSQIGRLVHTRGLMKGIPAEMYVALFLQHRSMFVLVGFARTRTFPRVSDELKQILSSFDLR